MFGKMFSPGATCSCQRASVKSKNAPLSFANMVSRGCLTTWSRGTRMIGPSAITRASPPNWPTADSSPSRRTIPTVDGMPFVSCNAKPIRWGARSFQSSLPNTIASSTGSRRCRMQTRNVLDFMGYLTAAKPPCASQPWCHAIASPFARLTLMSGSRRTPRLMPVTATCSRASMRCSSLT